MSEILRILMFANTRDCLYAHIITITALELQEVADPYRMREEDRQLRLPLGIPPDALL